MTRTRTTARTTARTAGLTAALTAAAVSLVSLSVPAATAATNHIEGNTCHLAFTDKEKAVGSPATWITDKTPNHARMDMTTLNDTRGLFEGYGNNVNAEKKALVDEIINALEACSEKRNYDKSNPLVGLSSPANTSPIVLSVIGVATGLGLIAMFAAPEIRNFLATTFRIYI